MDIDLAHLTDDQLETLEKAAQAWDLAAEAVLGHLSLLKEAQEGAGNQYYPSQGLNPYGLPISSAIAMDRVAAAMAWASLIGLSMGVGYALLAKSAKSRHFEEISRRWEEAEDLKRMRESQMEAIKRVSSGDRSFVHKMLGVPTKKELRKLEQEAKEEEKEAAFCQSWAEAAEIAREYWAAMAQKETIKEAAGPFANPLVDGMKWLYKKALTPIWRPVGTTTPEVTEEEAKAYGEFFQKTKPYFVQNFSFTDKPATYGAAMIALPATAFTAFFLLGKALANRLIPEDTGEWTKQKLIDAQKEFNRVLGRYLTIRLKRQQEFNETTKESEWLEGKSASWEDLNADYTLADPETSRRAALAAGIAADIIAGPAFIPQIVKEADILSAIGSTLSGAAKGLASIGTGLVKTISYPFIQGGREIAGGAYKAMQSAMATPRPEHTMLRSAMDVGGAALILLGGLAAYKIISSAVKSYRQYRDTQSQYGALRQAIIRDLNRVTSSFQLATDLPNPTALRLRFLKDKGALEAGPEVQKTWQEWSQLQREKREMARQLAEEEERLRRQQEGLEESQALPQTEWYGG